MKLLRFLDQETKAPKMLILSMAAISGMANGSILVVINIAANNVASQKELYFLILITIFLTYAFTLHKALSLALAAVEDALEQVKIRISNKIRNTELRFIEENKNIGAYSALIQDTNMIAEGVVQAVYSIQTGLMLLVTGFHLMVVSPVALLAISMIIFIAMPIFSARFRQTTKEMQYVSVKEAEFLSTFNSILQGFKELKLNQRENDEVFAQIKRVSDEMQETTARTNMSSVFDMIFASSVVYVLLLVTVFIIPNWVPMHSKVIYNITLTIIFIMGPLTMLVAGIPIFARIDGSISRLNELELKLDKANLPTNNLANDYPAFTHFQTLAMENVVFHYFDKAGQILFTSGPHTFTLQQGELLFIVGGNGSGKSTFLKLLTGLYQPEQGYVYLDDGPIGATEYLAYRELFSIVFTDFHLFDRLYGLPDLDEAEINAWLREMKLEKKTRIFDRHFTNTELSTGQKKRLAFIVAVLKKHPICIFDELAADQDPQFRRYFYQQVLPNLKAQGRTVIVVSHDDQYFNCADRVLKLEDGKIIT